MEIMSETCKTCPVRLAMLRDADSTRVEMNGQLLTLLTGLDSSEDIRAEQVAALSASAHAARIAAYEHKRDYGKLQNQIVAVEAAMAASDARHLARHDASEARHLARHEASEARQAELFEAISLLSCRVKPLYSILLRTLTYVARDKLWEALFPLVALDKSRLGELYTAAANDHPPHHLHALTTAREAGDGVAHFIAAGDLGGVAHAVCSMEQGWERKAMEYWFTYCFTQNAVDVAFPKGST